MKTILRIFISITIAMSSVGAHAAEMCSAVFFEGPHHTEALNEALQKAIRKDGSVKGLSSNDLEFLVEKIFDHQEDPLYKLSDYWRLTKEERILKVVSRNVTEELTHQGLLRYFENHNLLVDHDRLMTKLHMINESPLFHAGQALWSTVTAVTRGIPPIWLPRLFFTIKETDRTTLMLKGLDSAEGKEITARYGFKQEAIRGYTIFSRNYTYVMLAALTYIVFDKTLEFMKEKQKKESTDAFEFLMKQFQKLYGVNTSETKEDILFEVVIKKFEEKYNRLPNPQEEDLICHKVYGTKGCPQ